MFAREHVIECLLESFAPLGFGPERFVIVDNAVGIASSFSSVANDLPGQFSVGICAYIDRPYDHSGWQIVFDLFVFGLAQILRDL